MTKKSTHDRHAEHPPQAPEVLAHAREDELVHVPKGQSKLRFYLMLGLFIFVGITFVVPGAFMSTATGPTDKDVRYASWTRPDKSVVELMASDFFAEKRALRWIQPIAAAFGLSPFDPGEDFDTVRFLVMEDTARQAGMRISEQDVAGAIDALFQSPDDYRGWLANQTGLAPGEFETVFRRLLLVQRFRTFLAATASGVQPSEIEAVWRKSHQEYAFDYVQLDTAGFETAARSELPDDEALKAWFDALSPFERSEYDTELRWSADIAYVPLGGVEEWTFDATPLFAKHPRPEGEDAAAKALDYYERVKFTRFLRDQPLEGIEGPEGRVLPFDEVEALALREAPVYFSLEEWHRALNQRLADGSLVAEVDLAAEAAAIGLAFTVAGEPRAMLAWTEDKDVPYAGTRLPSTLRGLQVGRLTPIVIVEKGAFAVGQLAERLEPGTPPFEEIRDRVADAWVEERRTELAVAALEAVRGELGEKPAPPEPDPATGETPEPAEFLPNVDLARFQEACTAATYEVKRRDFAQRTFSQRGQDPAELEPVEAVLRSTPTLYTRADGDVSEPVADGEGRFAFLFRSAGQRDADLSQMKPLEYTRERQNLANAAIIEFFESTYDSKDFLRERYGLYLYDQTVAQQAPGP